MTKQNEILINDFAIRSFRDTADGDYIAARLAFRAGLIQNFLWSSLQAIEKYLKCILVINRIKAPKSHNISEILSAFNKTKKFELALSEDTQKFLIFLDTYGRHRYYETPYYIMGHEVISLDKAVWQIRQYARVMDYEVNLNGSTIKMLPIEIKANKSAREKLPHKYKIFNGRLERIISKRNDPSREPLIWQNAFYGGRSRKTITLPGRSEAGNSPLFLHPEILDEILKYVFLPKDVVDAYRNAKN